MKKSIFLAVFWLTAPLLQAQVLTEKNWRVEFSAPVSAKRAAGETLWDRQPESYLELGKAYAFGKGVKKNERKAQKYLKKAARKQLPQAQLLLAILQYESDNNTQKQKAFQEILRLAKDEYPPAQYALSGIYHNCAQDTYNPQEAFKWLIRAATAPTPVPQAQTRLAAYYYDGYPPYVAADKKRAFELFLAAAEAEEEYASYNVAQMYLRGEETEKNEKRAFHFMHQAAQDKLVAAQMALSEFYQKGIGVAPDAYGTFSWMLAAAKQDNAQAQVQTALHYLHGTGVAKSRKEALFWAEKAQQNGAPEAADIIRQIQEDL